MKNRNFFVDWYVNHGRNFPWRRFDVEPFHTLITEMVLRQTRAAGVAVIWPRLIENYGNPRALIDEDPNVLINLFKPLGFGIQKSESLRSASFWLLNMESGKVPQKRENLLLIPHVGLYVANAILSFAFNKRIEIVDTNVLRLFSRYYGIEMKPDIRRTPEAWRIARELLPSTKVATKAHNYGLLDFAADVCKPIRPRCEICPLIRTCRFPIQKSVSAM